MRTMDRIVVRDAERAVGFYADAFAAPDGRFPSVKIGVDDGDLHSADTFLAMGVLAPPTNGGARAVLALDVPHDMVGTAATGSFA
jgi:hypothetical protein